MENLTELERENRKLRQELAEMKLTFDLRWSADRRATRRWQAAHPGNALTWPDHTDMVVFLLEELEALTKVEISGHVASEHAVSEHASHELIEVDDQGVTKLPEAMVTELGHRIWFLRAEEHWEAWSENELDAALTEECGSGPGLRGVPRP